MILIPLEALFYLLLPEINLPKSGLGKSSCVNLWKVMQIANKKNKKKKANTRICLYLLLLLLLLLFIF